MLKSLTRYESHVIFWSGLILLFSVVYGFSPDSSNFLILASDHILSLPFYLSVSYLVAYLFIPGLLLNKKYLLFALATIITILIFAIAELLKTAYISMPLLYPEQEHEFNLRVFDISRASFYIGLPVVFFIAIKYLKNWYDINILKTELEREHLKKELKILKSQLHPSFLVDTLEILKVRAEKDPVAAAVGIEQVSELLSFILYEFNSPLIELEKEVRLIKTFISLQELNRETDIETNFKIIGGTENIKIPPLLLFPLVEFLFKSILTAPGKIKIRLFLEIQNKNIDFWTECNECPEVLTETGDDRIIINLRKRLKILYKGKHRFETKQRVNMFILHLNFNSD